MDIRPDINYQCDYVVMSDGHEVPADRIDEFNEMRRKEREEFFKREREKQAAIETGKTCPFKGDKNVSACTKDCSFYEVDQDHCIFATPGDGVKDIEPNSFCPIYYTKRCIQPRCAFYFDGCALYSTFKTR